MRVGFIGTGIMGSAMVRCLLRAGHELTVYDIQRDATAQVCNRGARWGESPAAIARLSEVVFTSLPGPTEVEEVVLHPSNGLLTGLNPGSVFIDTSTNSLSSIRKLAEACRSKGIEVLDAPISRREPGDKGLPPVVTMMVGGELETFTKYRALLENISSDVFYVGQTGNGMAAKAINQFLICASFLLGAEALLVGAKAGIDINTLCQVLSMSSAGRSVSLEPFPQIVFKGEFRRGFSPGGPLDRWVKDINCAREVADSVNAPSNFLETVQKTLRSAQSQGLGDSVWYAVVQVLEQMIGANLRVSNEKS
jgi:3-hydroxyisobutyrate dehydrogenase-like beta-hydroxyacid dehydrogenase